MKSAEYMRESGRRADQRKTVTLHNAKNSWLRMPTPILSLPAPLSESGCERGKWRGRATDSNLCGAEILSGALEITTAPGQMRTKNAGLGF
jgi:hypothetical protein